MIRLIRKFTILVIAAIILERLINIGVQKFLYYLYKTITSYDLPVVLYTIYSERVLVYLINLVFVFIIYKEMKNEKLVSIPILILTFFANIPAVIFFILTIAYKKLNKQ